MITFKVAKFSILPFLLLCLYSAPVYSAMNLCESTLSVAEKFSDMARETLRLRRDHPATFHMSGRPGSLAEMRFVNILVAENPDAVIGMMLTTGQGRALNLNSYTMDYRAFLLRDFQRNSEMDLRTGHQSLLTRVIAGTAPLEGEAVLDYLARVHRIFMGALDKQEGTIYKLKSDDDEFISMNVLNEEFKGRDLARRFEDVFFMNTVFDRFLNFEKTPPSPWNIFNPTYLLLAELRVQYSDVFIRLTTVSEQINPTP